MTMSPSLYSPDRAGVMDDAHGRKDLSSQEVYRGAMTLMWNYQLEQAMLELEPWRLSSAWHAGAYAECYALRVVMTGSHSDASKAMELVSAAEALVSKCSDATGSSGIDVLSAELLLIRSGLQVFLGARLRALFNLRQCWYAYCRLERQLDLDILGGGQSRRSESAASSGDKASQQAREQAMTLSGRDLRGRILLGAGFFYLAVSLLPAGFLPFARLVGFVMDREKGKALLTECVERQLGPRATLAALVLSMYHLDLEADLARSGDLLVWGLQLQPENVLLHWAGSVLAWRNTCIPAAGDLAQRALWCCGEELGGKAIYLRYELGMFYFISMSWPKAHAELRYIWDSSRTEKIFLPYKTLVGIHLAAVALNMGRDEEGESICHECGQEQTSLRLESDFVKILQLLLKHRVRGRQLFAFEVMYLFRQFPKVPSHMLLDIQTQVEKAASPFRGAAAQLSEQVQAGSGKAAAASGRPHAHAGRLDTEVLVECASSAMVLSVISFYQGDLDQAMAVVPELSLLCAALPAWATYLAAHSLYWCGRIFDLSGHRDEALRCLKQGKALKKYPFNIESKISTALAQVERAHSL